RKDEIVMAQGDPANAVFYIRRGTVKVTAVSEQGKEAVVAMLGTNDFFGKNVLPGSRGAKDNRLSVKAVLSI
ncbi:MAG: Crp/Fnr family transcriptional regulator, partial [Methylocella sp.]